MNIDLSTLGLQTANALILIWLLGHFLFRPVADAIAARQQAAAQLLADARAAKAAAESERDKAASGAALLAEHRAEAFRAAESQAGAAKAALLAKAQAETDKLLAAGRAELGNERQKETLAADDRAARLAVDIAAKLLDRLPPEARISGFIQGMETGLAKLSQEARASIGADGAPVRLSVARALTSEETEAIQRTLAEVLGRPVTVETSVDPTLIAGIELEAPLAVVRNSFRADLNRLKSALVHHDTDNA